MLTKMLPSFGKRSLATEVDQITDKLKTFTIPAYKSLGGDKLSSETGTYFESLYASKVGRGNMYQGILKSLETCLALCNYIDDQVDARFQEDITRASLTAYTLNMLKLIETINFTSDYSRRLCRYLATAAVNKAIGLDELTDITKAEQNYINQYKYSFFDALTILGKPTTDLQNKLDMIPDIVVTADNLDSVNSAVGKAVVDPLALNFISTSWNPALFVGTKIARYQADKYNQAKLDLQEIQCKTLKLKQLKSGKEDAKLDRQIDFYENLNDKVRANIEEMEEQYDIG